MADPGAGQNATMNRLIVEGFHQGQRFGAMARLAGAPSVAEDRREHLNRLLDERDQAMRADDGDALAFVESKIDRLFDQTRQARSDRPRDEQGRFTSTDEDAEAQSWGGGFRGRRSVASPGVQQETAGDLFKRAMAASQQERAERGADEAIIAGNT
jgi:hypothetical protein